MKKQSEELLIPAAKSMAAKMLSRKKLTYSVFQIIFLDAKFSGWTHSKPGYIPNSKQIPFCLVVRVHKCCCSDRFTWMWEISVWKYFCVSFWCHSAVYVQKIQNIVILDKVSTLDLCWCYGLNGGLGCSDSWGPHEALA